MTRFVQFPATAQDEAGQLARKYLRSLRPAMVPTTGDVRTLMVLLLAFAQQYHTPESPVAQLRKDTR